jgi:predicted CXXCH cytochrome family protein
MNDPEVLTSCINQSKLNCNSKGDNKMHLIKVLIFMTFIIFTLGLLTFPSYATEENACIECHEDLKKPSKSVHAVMKMGCSACHKSVEGKSHPDQKGSIVLTQNMPGLCYGCHKESKFKGKSGHTLLGMCTGCHNPHSSNSNKLLLSDQPDLCYACHDKAKFTKKYVHKIINVGGCTSCHEPHISDHPSLLSSPEYELCVSCHAAKVKGSHVVALPGRKRHPIIGVKDPSTLKMIEVPDPKNPKRQIEVPDPNVPGKNMNCSSCHEPHSSDFKGLLTQARICTKCHKV